MNTFRPPLPAPTPDEIERKAASIAKLTARDPVLAQRIRRITEMCKRDMPKPTSTKRDEVIA